ncbi:M23 family metallopeptidase [cf. Phormidesmis sp. LEGE 11477]|uniref:LysM peptidoglycan-binding domain-containing M23 family metallopeptidase n=1 Tax=cf. Phormidesmis sp. LEGE 11477 TaxID=1828680 RepID=UPI001881F58D|nr:M23 family metallopeptidase [cf. Phormidesmis sp. LEGE 11477]MBE9061777.1 M23 family metallopeptidase [cf. Phormidesmis sp. LEGE 11477]
MRRLPTLSLVAIAQLSILTLTLPLASAAVAASCPAALSQLQQHQATAGETLETIAARYNLRPATLARFNGDLNLSSGAAVRVGQEIVIPPFDGQVVAVTAGSSWQTLAEQYNSRADLLFEINGCVSQVPSRVFIPGANRGISRTVTAANRDAIAPQLPGYPLSQPAAIQLSYGWQPHPSQDEVVFNSGLAFGVPVPTEVKAVGAGTVAFAGEREGYGQLLVINHEQGLQTRYANLNEISVSVGQSVSTGTTVGAVGADQPTYLYFEVRRNSPSGWIAQDPGEYLPALELR